MAPTNPPYYPNSSDVHGTSYRERYPSQGSSIDYHRGDRSDYINYRRGEYDRRPPPSANS